MFMPRNSLVSSTVVGDADKKGRMSVKSHRALLGSNFLLISTETWAVPDERLPPTAAGRVPRLRNVAAKFRFAEEVGNVSQNGMWWHGRTTA